MRWTYGRSQDSPWFSLFLHLRSSYIFNKWLRHRTRCKSRPKSEHAGVIMEETAQKSCWGVTLRALAGFAAFLALTYLFGTP